MAQAITEEWCDRCDMALFGCEHGQGLTLAVAPPEPRPAEPKMVPWAWYFDSEAYRSQWQTVQGHHRLEVIRCSDDHRTGAQDDWLCPTCADAFQACLEDVRGLAYDLSLARTKQVAFIPHGHRMSPSSQPEDPDKPQEEPVSLPWDQAASDALGRLQRALEARSGQLLDVAEAAQFFWLRAARDETLRDRVARISSAVLHGFAVVDRPPDLWYFGECPRCHTDLYGERSLEVISCSHCDYAASRIDHQRVCLDAGDDRMLTVGELVGAITSAGETVTRDQINGWIRREGLPREQMSRPSWRKGRLIYVTVYVYRLGDVRALAQRAEDHSSRKR